MYAPSIIYGNTYQDERGSLCFVNGFDMSGVKRFYTISHPDITIIRAWQGHKIEQKWFHVLDGAFEIRLVQLDDWVAPSPRLPIQEFKLSSSVSQVLQVPAGFATGFRAQIPNSRMIIYSNLPLEESFQDDFRFDKNLWCHWD